MKIKPYDGLLRYLVDSDRPDVDPYLVDLTMYWGTGCCSCDHFKFRLEKELTIRPLKPEQFRCKHIRASREFLADELIDTLVRQQIKMETPVRAKGGLSPHFTRPGTIPFRLEKTNK